MKCVFITFPSIDQTRLLKKSMTSNSFKMLIYPSF